MAKNQRPVIELNKNQKESGSKIEVIKNLIFGDDIQAYDSEFKLLKEDILDKKRALEKLMDEVREELMTTIDNLSTDVNLRISDVEKSLGDKIESLDTTKVDKKMLGKALMDLGESISEK